MNSISSPQDPLIEALKVVPEVAPETEAKQDDKGVLHLRRPMPTARGWLRYFKTRQWIRVELDERGKWFWDRINGKHNLAAIARAMTEEFDVDREEAQAAVVAFTKMLMLRHLIVLRTHLAKGRTP